ncbi:hypothetical protein Tco_0642501, partial [Tanacetum coccineum]
VIQNGNSKKRISTRKDGIVRILSPVTATEIQAVEKERKAKNILLMAIPKEHMRRFHESYPTYLQSFLTSSPNIPEKEVLAGFADEEEQHRGHILEKKRDSFINIKKLGKQEKNQMGLLTMDDGIVNWGEHTEVEETNHALMAIISSMSSNSKVGLGFEIQSNNEVLSYKEEINFSVFNCSKEDSVGKPLYSRFTKTNDFKGVPHPLSGDYTPTPQEEIDESLYVYGKKGHQEPEPNVSDDRSSEYSTCQSNDSAGSIGTSSELSVDP